MIHQLKLQTTYFDDVLSGKKTFETRKNDRGFQVNDFLALNEFDPETERYTGRSCLVYIDYILDDVSYNKVGYVTMSIKPVFTMKNKSPINVCSLEIDYGVPLATGKDVEEDGNKEKDH